MGKFHRWTGPVFLNIFVEKTIKTLTFLIIVAPGLKSWLTYNWEQCQFWLKTMYIFCGQNRLRLYRWSSVSIVSTSTDFNSYKFIKPRNCIIFLISMVFSTNSRNFLIFLILFLLFFKIWIYYWKDCFFIEYLNVR